MVRRGRPRRAGLALIELLVAIIIIALLAGAFYGFWRKGKPGQKTIPGEAVDKAKGVECQNMLQQARAAIEMGKMDNEDRPPASLPPDVAKCPETGQPYSYDPQTGRVWCTTPGHEEL